MWNKKIYKKVNIIYIIKENFFYHVYVVVQFCPWFKFYFLLFWGMVIYDNEFETKKNKIWTKDKIEPQHIYGIKMFSKYYNILKKPSKSFSSSESQNWETDWGRGGIESYGNNKSVTWKLPVAGICYHKLTKGIPANSLYIMFVILQDHKFLPWIKSTIILNKVN